MDVKQLRDEFGLSQEDLAKLSLIPRDRIAKWEQGKGNPKHEDVMRLTDIEVVLRFVRIHVQVQAKVSREKVPNSKNIASNDDGESEYQKTIDKEIIRDLRSHIKTLEFLRDNQEDRLRWILIWRRF